MARILVTGAAGFLGAAVVAALAARGNAVTALDLGLSPRLAALVGSGNVAFQSCEITEWPLLLDAFARARPEAVVHCAAVVGVVNASAAPLTTLRVNVEGILGVLAAMRLSGVRRMVNLSTEEIYYPAHQVRTLGVDATRAGVIHRRAWLLGEAHAGADDPGRCAAA